MHVAVVQQWVNVKNHIQMSGALWIARLPRSVMLHYVASSGGTSLSLITMTVMLSFVYRCVASRTNAFAASWGFGMVRTS